MSVFDITDNEPDPLNTRFQRSNPSSVNEETAYTQSLREINFCPTCGENVEDEAIRFCPSCGASIR